jgi:hypothetical protein
VDAISKNRTARRAESEHSARPFERVPGAKGKEVRKLNAPPAEILRPIGSVHLNGSGDLVSLKPAGTPALPVQLEAAARQMETARRNLEAAREAQSSAELALRAAESHPLIQYASVVPLEGTDFVVGSNVSVGPNRPFVGGKVINLATLKEYPREFDEFIRLGDHSLLTRKGDDPAKEDTLAVLDLDTGSTSTVRDYEEKSGDSLAAFHQVQAPGWVNQGGIPALLAKQSVRLIHADNEHAGTVQSSPTYEQKLEVLKRVYKEVVAFEETTQFAIGRNGPVSQFVDLNTGTRSRAFPSYVTFKNWDIAHDWMTSSLGDFWQPK